MYVTKQRYRLIRGSYGEKIARSYLRGKNFRIVAKNYRCRLGEIDIVAQKKDILVFVEVKTRLSKNFGEPFESVTKAKQKKLKRLGEYFLMRNRLWNQTVRFDIISIVMDHNGLVNEFVHIENAF